MRSKSSKSISSHLCHQMKLELQVIKDTRNSDGIVGSTCRNILLRLHRPPSSNVSRRLITLSPCLGKSSRFHFPLPIRLSQHYSHIEGFDCKRCFSNKSKSKNQNESRSVSIRYLDDDIEVLTQRTERFVAQMSTLESSSIIIAQMLTLLNQWVVLISKNENDTIISSTPIHKDPTEVGLIVEKLISSFQSLCDNQQNIEKEKVLKSELKPTLEIYSLAIDAWIHCSRQCQDQDHNVSLCIRKAEEWLWVMLRNEALLERYTSESKQDTLSEDDSERINSCIAMVIHALCKNKDEDSMDRAQNIMNHSIRDVFVNDNRKDGKFKGVSPNTTVFNSFLHVYSKISEDTLEKSYLLLKYMIQEWESGNNKQMEPNHVSFNTVIHGYAMNGNAEMVEEIVSLWKQKCDPNQNVHSLSSKPDKTTFNILIDAYSKSSHPSTVRKAEELISWMEGLWLEGQVDLKPDKISFTCLIDTFARHGEAEKAEAVLRKMSDLYEAGDVEMNPDAYTFSSVIKAWTSRSSRDTKSLDHCFEIIRLMETRLKQGLMSKNQPLTVAYNTLINMIGRSKQKNCGSKVLEILEHMKRLQKEYGTLVAPNIETYNEIISILGKCGQIEDTERIYNQVSKDPSLSLNIISINSYLDALSRNKNKRMPEVALKILAEVEDKAKNNDSNVHPNTRTYNIVINVLSKSGPRWCERAEDVLTRLENQMEKNTNQMNLKPDIISYSTCINAWSKSRCYNKAEKAYKVLKRLKRAHEMGILESSLNIFPYNGVLNACAFTKGDSKNRKKAFTIAKSVFHDAITTNVKDVQADEITYATMLKACTNLQGFESNHVHSIKPIVKHCCEHGFLGPLVIKELNYTLSHPQRIELLGLEQDFDPRWSQNVTNQ